MKKIIIVCASLALTVGMLGGCSNKNDKAAENTVNRSSDYVKKDIEKNARKTKNDVEESNMGFGPFVIIDCYSLPK